MQNPESPRSLGKSTSQETHRKHQSNGYQLGQRLVNFVFSQASINEKSALVFALLNPKNDTENLPYLRFKEEIESIVLKVILIYDESVSGQQVYSLTRKEFTVLSQVVRLSANSISFIGEDSSCQES